MWVWCFYDLPRNSIHKLTTHYIKKNSLFLDRKVFQQRDREKNLRGEII